MRRLVLPTAAAVVLCVCVPALAQKTYTLERKYKVGDVALYEVVATGAGAMEMELAVPEGQQAPPAPPGGDIWVDAKVEMLQEVKAVDEQGVGEIVLRLPSIDLSMQMFGMSQDINVQDDHVRITVNGQVMFDSAAAGQNKQMAQVFSILQDGIVMKMDKRGRTVEMPGMEMLKAMMPQGMDFKAAMNMSTGDLPDHPVKVGDTWEQVQAIPMPLPEGKGLPEFVTKYTLEAIETVRGIECAKVAMNMDASLAEPVKMSLSPGMVTGAQIPPGTAVDITIEKLDVALTGNQHIALATGMLESSTMNLKITQHLRQKMKIQQGDKTQDIEFTMKIDGLEVDVEITRVE
ncbi:MAG: hypothetical protein ACE5O2_06690 [Armatimonadota bacterium]